MLLGMVLTEVALPGSAEVVPVDILELIQVAEMEAVEAVHRINWAYSLVMAAQGGKALEAVALVLLLPSAYLDGAVMVVMGSVWSSLYKT